MTSESSSSWALDIRRQVFGLLAILVSLVAIAAGYNFWSQVSIDDRRDRINTQHLVSNSLYLRAMEELRNLQVHLQRASSDADQPHWPTGLDSGGWSTQLGVLFHLVEKHMQSGLEVEKTFADPRFAMLTNKTEQHLLQLSQIAGNSTEQRFASEKIDRAVDRLLISGDQIVRLHSIVRDEELARLRGQKLRQDYVFYALVMLLLVIAIFFARSGFTAIDRIIREQMGIEARIRKQAHYDNLTQLPNRFLAMDRLSQMISEARRKDSRVAVLFIDLDFFKKVNDILGHVNGDQVLVEAAQRISRSLRAGDTVGRLGGDEFIVLSKDFKRVNEVVRIAENLIRTLSDPIEIDGREVILTASIGISIYPDDASEELELIRRADSAMYRSKEEGRNTYSYYTPSMNRNLSRQFEIEERLQHALERNEFDVVYQPKINLENRRIVGAEALLRWHNDKLGVLPPAEFLPLAERSGLIIPIGNFVLGKALHMAGQWQRNALPDFRISINVSTRQFRDPDLVNHISRALHAADVPSESLELEFDEGVLMHDYLHIGQALEELSKLGVTIALDDFGTGFSSLSYLRNYPIDVIKMDLSYIADVDRNPRSLALNDAAISMAHALGISVVAEGVETWGQCDVLQQLQCDYAQGYYFGKPMPAEQLSRVLNLQKHDKDSGSVVNLANRRRDSKKRTRRK